MYGGRGDGWCCRGLVAGYHSRKIMGFALPAMEPSTIVVSLVFISGLTPYALDASPQEARRSKVSRLAPVIQTVGLKGARNEIYKIRNRLFFTGSCFSAVSPK